MRKYAKLLLVVVLVIISVCTLFACNNAIPPSNIGGSTDGNTETGDEMGTPVGLSFEIGDGKGSSIFKHMYVDEFSLNDVTCFVNREYVKNGITVVNKNSIGKLTMDMIDESCKELIKEPGNHMIKCTTVVGGKKVKGSFDLHLQERYENDYSDLEFNLDGGTSGFGSVDESGKITVKVKAGSMYMWGEFLGKYPVYKSEIVDGKTVVYAIQKWNYTKDSGETGYFDTTAGHNSITLEPGMSLTAVWTKDTINVKFDLNLPADAEYNAESGAPVAPTDQTVSRLGMISRPSVKNFNTLVNYEFIGWYYEGKAWNFNSLVGSANMTLTAHWEIKTYSLTFYLMGGEFKADVPDAPKGTYESESITDFAFTTNYPFKVQFKNLRYGSKYNDYTATVSTDMIIDKDGNRVVSDEAVLNPVELKNNVSKGRLANGNSYFKLDDWYSELDLSDSDKFTINENTKVAGDVSLYAKWEDVMGGDKELMNDYYVNYLFKDGLSVKSDGTISIDYLTDWSINELVLPKEIKMPGDIYRNVSAIADNAVQNVQTLVTVDMRQATGLTTIGELTFAYATSLKNVYFPGDTVDENGKVTASTANNITTIKEQAFRGTLWEDEYYQNQRHSGVTAENGLGYIIINGILYRYVGGYAYDGRHGVKIKEIDASKLIGVKTIAEKSFMNLPLLTKVILPTSVENIQKDAFFGCKVLEDVTVSNDAESKLSYIDANAFNDTVWRKGKGSAGDESLKLGGIYYLYTGGTNNSTAIIPAGTKIIAPNAFTNGSNIENIYFGGLNDNDSVKQIEKIGADAFTKTKWIKTASLNIPDNKADGAFKSQDGIATVNGMLVNYTGTNRMPVIPDYVNRIVENAFSSFSNNYVTHITVAPTKTPLIVEDRAFSGCSKVQAITFESAKSLSYGTNNKPTVNGNVAISEGSFLNRKNGALGNGLKVYIEGSQYNKLTKISSVIPVWTELYENNNDMFLAFTVLSVTFNTDEIGTRFIARNDNWSLFNQLREDHKDDGKFTQNGNNYTLNDAFIVTYNNDAVKKESCTAIKSAWDVKGTGSKSFSVRYGDNITPTWDFYVVAAIKGSDDFRWDVSGKDNKYINGKDTVTGNEDTPIRITGLNDIYYTTNSTLDLTNAQLEYRYFSDAASSTRNGIVSLSEENVKVEGYATSVGSHQLIITFNYEGFDTFKITWNYIVEKNVNRKLVQDNGLSLPLNSKPGEYLKSAYVTLVKNDGTEKRIALSSSQIKISFKNADGSSTDVFATDKIGYHTAQITYKGGVDGDVVCENYLYSVVMQSDQSMFEFERFDVNATELADEGFKGTANVIGLKNDFKSGKVIIPYRYEYRHKVNGKEVVDFYKVTGIADSLFEGNRNIDTVWIPSTVTEISDKAFKNCVNLKNVYGFDAMDSGIVSEMPDNQFDILSQDKIYNAKINVNSLRGVNKLPEIVVPGLVSRYKDVEKKDINGAVEYISHERYDCSVTLSSDVFASYNGIIRLPDTEYFHSYAGANLAGKTVAYYAEGANEPTNSTFFRFGDVTDKVVSAATRQLRYKNAGTPTAPKDADGNYVYDDHTFVIPGFYTFKFTEDGSTDEYEGRGEIVEFAKGAFDNLVKGCKLYLPNNFTNSVPTSESIVSTWEVYNIYDVYAKDILSPTKLFPTSIETIGNEAFYGCTSLKKVEFSAKTSALKSLGTHAFANSRIQYSATEAGGLDLSKTKLTEISTNALMACEYLVKVKLPSTVKVINNGAFLHCLSLTSITFDNGDAGFKGLTYVGDYSFGHCPELVPFNSQLSAACIVSPTAFDGCKPVA